MALLRKLFWFAMFLISTFCFVVLFEHGPRDFASSATTEFDNLKRFYGTKVERKKDESDKVAQ